MAPPRLRRRRRPVLSSPAAGGSTHEILDHVFAHYRELALGWDGTNSFGQFLSLQDPIVAVATPPVPLTGSAVWFQSRGGSKPIHPDRYRPYRVHLDRMCRLTYEEILQELGQVVSLDLNPLKNPNPIKQVEAGMYLFLDWAPFAPYAKWFLRQTLARLSSKDRDNNEAGQRAAAVIIKLFFTSRFRAPGRTKSRSAKEEHRIRKSIKDLHRQLRPFCYQPTVRRETAPVMWRRLKTSDSQLFQRLRRAGIQSQQLFNGALIVTRTVIAAEEHLTDRAVRRIHEHKD